MLFRKTAAALALAAAALTARAEDAPSKGPVFTGLFDFYYLFQTRNPPRGSIVPGHLLYDARHNTPTLALAELNATKAAPKGGFGYKATLIAGDVADLNHAGYAVTPTSIGGTDTREGSLKNIQQLYLTYQTPSGYTFDFGKFATPMGYEVIEATGNWAYSHSQNFNIVPIYHTGLRATTPSMGGLVLSAHVVNAMFNTARAGVYDDNGSKDVMGQAIYTRSPLTIAATVGTGRDKLDTVHNQRTTLADMWATWALNGKTTLAANIDYRKDRTLSDVPGNRFVALAAYVHHVFDAKQAGTLRYSRLDQKIQPAGGPDSSVKPWEVTATYERKLTPALTTRFEVRHDGANSPLFLDGSGAASKKSQNTVLVAGLYTF